MLWTHQFNFRDDQTLIVTIPQAMNYSITASEYISAKLPGKVMSSALTTLATPLIKMNPMLGNVTLSGNLQDSANETLIKSHDRLLELVIYLQNDFWVPQAVLFLVWPTYTCTCKIVPTRH